MLYRDCIGILTQSWRFRRKMKWKTNTGMNQGFYKALKVLGQGLRFRILLQTLICVKAAPGLSSVKPLRAAVTELIPELLLNKLNNRCEIHAKKR